KGVAGNIGAKNVHSAAAVLEKLIRDGAERGAVASAQDQLAAALEPLATQLRSVLVTPTLSPPAAPAVPAAADSAKSKEAVAKLLAEFDPDAADFIETNHALVRPLFSSEAWTPFQRLVQSYAFAEAQTQLEQALNNLPPQ